MGYSMESLTRKQMIEDALKKKGLSKLALARELGRSISTINRWIDGDSTPELTPQETVDMLKIFGDLETLVQMFPGYSRRREAMKRVSK
jgi:ribosome-binding protein aMBF1 (putative translation factor)